MPNLISNFVVLAGVVLIWTASAATEVQPISLSSGVHNNDGSEPRLAYAAVIAATNSLTRVRVHFGNYQLGTRSYARLQSVQDGQEQRLNTAAMKNWSSTSAMFNGSAVRVELYVGSGDSGVFINADSVIGDCASCVANDPA